MTTYNYTTYLKIYCNESSSRHVPTNNTVPAQDREYIITPVGKPIMVTVLVLLAFAGFVGFFGNLLVLFLKWKQYNADKHKTRRPFERQVTSYFVSSLALSDILASLFSVPLFSIQKTTEHFQTDIGCRGVRFISLMCSLITVTNLIVIGVERYMGIFYPLKAPSRKTTKTLLILAWLTGVSLSFISCSTVKMVKYDIGPDKYTLICRSDTSVLRNRIIVMVLVSVMYFIPSLFLMYSCFVITRFIRQRQRQRRGFHGTISGSAAFKGEMTKNRTTKMFVTVILTFILPYFVYVVYMTVYALTGSKHGLLFDHIIPLASSVLVVGNCAVNPLFYFFFSSSDLRNLARRFISPKFPWTRRRVSSRMPGHCFSYTINKNAQNRTQGAQQSTRGDAGRLTRETKRRLNYTSGIDGSQATTYDNVAEFKRTKSDSELEKISAISDKHI